MPDSEVARIVAEVPSCSGATASPISMVTMASALLFSSMSEIEPIGCPPTRTSLPGTSWPAFSKTALTLYGSPPPNIARASSATAAISAASARIRATVEPRSLWSGSRVLPSLLLESKRGQPTDASRSAMPARLPSYSIPSGPCASPDKNCLTNWLSELKSSLAGPDSTILPFQRIAM